MIKPNDTMFYSLLYLNSPRGHGRLKYLTPVIRVKMERLPGNTKKRLFTRSWTARVRFLHPWAEAMTVTRFRCVLPHCTLTSVPAKLGISFNIIMMSENHKMRAGLLLRLIPLSISLRNWNFQNYYRYITPKTAFCKQQPPLILICDYLNKPSPSLIQRHSEAGGHGRGEISLFFWNRRELHQDALFGSSWLFDFIFLQIQ